MYGDGYLNSWKEVAQYVGRSERTIQRWERDLGFPVHRPAGKLRSSVIAVKEEIDAWIRRTPKLHADSSPAGLGQGQPVALRMVQSTQ